MRRRSSVAQTSVKTHLKNLYAREAAQRLKPRRYGRNPTTASPAEQAQRDEDIVRGFLADNVPPERIPIRKVRASRRSQTSI